MSRSQPYRSRVPTHIIKLLDVASRITLFLVDQNGPLSFIFKDRLQNKYKTTIGSEIKCTCSPNKNDHCIHSLYVLLKIFKVNVENPIMWQAGYLDNQLEDLTRWKYTQHNNNNIRQRGSNRQINQRNQIQSYQAYNFSSNRSIQDIINLRNKQKMALYKGITGQKLKKQQKNTGMQLQQDSVCPICQQQLRKQMCLTYCKIGCGNNYHLECLKVWVTHKRNQQSKVTCPMCRQEFPPSILQQLKTQQLQYKKKQIIKKSQYYKCNSCGLDKIANNVHKCLLCSNFQLCEVCYLGKKHLKHPFVKMNQNGEWHGAQQRRSNQIKIKQFIDNKKKQNKNKQLLQKLRKIQQDPRKLLDYVASSYPYVSKYISQNIDPYKKLDINQQNMCCQKCKSKRMIFLRRLPCGHFIDHQCLKQNIRKQKFFCEQDGMKILKGYEDLMQKQKQLQFEKQKVQNQMQIQEQFNPRHIQQNQSIVGRNNMPLSSQINNQQIYNFRSNIIPNHQRLSNLQIFNPPSSTYESEQPQISSLADILRPGNLMSRNGRNIRIKQQRVSNRLIDRLSNNRIKRQQSIEGQRRGNNQSESRDRNRITNANNTNNIPLNTRKTSQIRATSNNYNTNSHHINNNSIKRNQLPPNNSRPKNHRQLINDMREMVANNDLRRNIINPLLSELNLNNNRLPNIITLTSLIGSEHNQIQNRFNMNINRQ